MLAAGTDSDTLLEALAAELLEEALRTIRRPPLERHRRWLSHALQLLAETPCSGTASQVQCDVTTRDKIELLQQMVQALPEILSGRIRATQILFPGGSMQRVQRMQRSSSSTMRGPRSTRFGLCTFGSTKRLSDLP